MKRKKKTKKKTELNNKLIFIITIIAIAVFIFLITMETSQEKKGKSALEIKINECLVMDDSLGVKIWEDGSISENSDFSDKAKCLHNLSIKEKNVAICDYLLEDIVETRIKTNDLHYVINEDEETKKNTNLKNQQFEECITLVSIKTKTDYCYLIDEKMPFEKYLKNEEDIHYNISGFKVDCKVSVALNLKDIDLCPNTASYSYSSYDCQDRVATRIIKDEYVDKDTNKNYEISCDYEYGFENNSWKRKIGTMEEISYSKVFEELNLENSSQYWDIFYNTTRESDFFSHDKIPSVTWNFFVDYHKENEKINVYAVYLTKDLEYFIATTMTFDKEGNLEEIISGSVENCEDIEYLITNWKEEEMRIID